ncbi:serine/threonine-protein kinase [Blastococcus sp. SYSU D00669]
MVQPGLDVGTVVSRYRVEELVARGGMGLVYRAVDLRLDRSVALKVLTPELSEDARFRERFVRESRLAAAVDHPHVIPVYEADEWHGLLYIAMRFVRGADLHTVLATRGPLDPAPALHLLDQGADALDAAHEAGLVHRDVKPGNFLLSGASAEVLPPRTHVYLTDFGLTKRATSGSGLTRTGQFLGSLHYVAPEQIRGEDVDARTDVYALACVAHEVLAGAPPFPHEEQAALLWAHMSTAPPPVTDARPELPGAVDDVLAAGMAKDRHDRPGSAGEFVRALRTALGEEVPAAPARTARTPAPPTVRHARHHTPVQPEPPPPAQPPVPGPPDPEPVSQRLRRPWWPVAVAALAAVALVLALWRPWSSGPDLETRELVVVPYAADLPADWEMHPVQDVTDALVFGPAGLVVPTGGNGEEFADVAAEEPERSVGVHVSPGTGLEDEALGDLPGQIATAFPGEMDVRVAGPAEVAGQDGFRLEGTYRLGEADLGIHGVVVGGEILLICAAPESIFDDWRPTFEEITASVRATS